jgi:iron complex outermembrane receptor protein
MLFLCLFCALHEAPAQGTKDRMARNTVLPEVVVQGEKPFSPHQAGVDIEKTPGRVGRTAVDALQQEPGLDLQRKGLLIPNSKMLKLRGFDTEKTLVTFDGRQINGAGVFGGYQVDWTQMPLVDVRSIEVTKGALSAEHGNTIGGVINLVPRKPGEELQLELGAGIKSYNTRQTEGYAAGRFSVFQPGSDYKPLGFSLGASFMETDGHLRNTEAERVTLTPSLYCFFPDEGYVKLGLRYSQGEFETPITNQKASADFDPDFPESQGHALVGPGINPSSQTLQAMEAAGLQGVVFGDGSFYDKERFEWDIELSKELLGIDWKARYHTAYERRTDEYFARTTAGGTQEGDLILERQAPGDDSWGAKLKAEKKLGDHRLKVGAERRSLGYRGIEIDVFDTDYLRRNFSETRDQENLITIDSFFVSDRYALLDNLDIFLGLRYDDYEADHDDNPGERIPEVSFERWSPSVGLYFRPHPDVLTYASYARTAKFPIIPKYFWFFNGLQPGMAGFDFERSPLTFEEADQYEAGVEYTGLREAKIGLSAYYYVDENYLRWIFGYPRSRVVYNLDEVTVTGTELSLEGRIWRDFHGYANWTWQQTDLKGAILADRSLSGLGLPKHKINLGVSYRPKKDFVASFEVKYADERQQAQGPLVFGKASATDMDVAELDSYWLAGAVVQYPISEHWLVYGGIENLFDEDYQETSGFPMPDRSYFAGVQWQL